MARNMFITIRDKKFVDISGEYDQVSATTANGGGWVCTIAPDGAVRCVFEKEYEDGTWSITYAIRADGFARTTLREPGELPRTLRKGYIIHKGESLDGVIGLSCVGHVKERFGFFRKQDFNEVMREFRLTNIRRESPNMTFFLKHSKQGENYCRMDLFTDGTRKQVVIDNSKTLAWRKEDPDTQNYEWTESINVTGAKWVIVQLRQSKDGQYLFRRILYTLESPFSLELPKAPRR